MADVGQNLPSYYKKSRYIKALDTPINAEFERLYEFIEMFMKNRFIDSADEDTVRAYEKSLGISEIADNIEVRKSYQNKTARNTDFDKGKSESGN